MLEAQKDIINRLQKDILQWQGFAPAPVGIAKGIGLGPLEAAFPNGVFPTGAIHEMLCPTPEQAAATGGLLTGIIALLKQHNSTCLWISTSRRLFPPALMAFNVEPDSVIFIDVGKENDVLWAMEEALKCEGLAAVVAEVQEISFAQSRRLQLAVESSKVTGFLLRNNVRKLGNTTCVARWQVTPLPSQTHDELPGIGFPRWQVDLLRVRNGNPGSWKLEWVDAKFMPIDEVVQATQLNERKAG